MFSLTTEPSHQPCLKLWYSFTCKHTLKQLREMKLACKQLGGVLFWSLYYSNEKTDNKWQALIFLHTKFV